VKPINSDTFERQLRVIIQRNSR